MDLIDVFEYYGRRYVRKEIYSFLIGRWVGIEGVNRKWVRWFGDKPLTIKSPEDIPILLHRFKNIKPRSFYGSIEVFHRLINRSDVMENYENNVAYTTVFIDIDIVDESRLEECCETVLKIGGIIRDWLEEHSVSKSLYFLWSGAGLHVRVNEYCFEEVLDDHHPVDIAYVFTEYVLRNTSNKIQEILSNNNRVKVENLVAMKRVFTAPLSLHRRLDRVAVAFGPNDLEDFSLEWTNPVKPIYREKIWNRHGRGECDEITRKALSEIKTIVRRTVIDHGDKTGVKEEIIRIDQASEPGRFQVMALLQAVRHYLLYNDLDRAKSFGLNRAIFYAWAKYYGPGKRSFHTGSKRIYGVKTSGEVSWVEECGEKVQQSSSGYYVMGGIEQRPEDFDRYVARKFREKGIDPNEAWKKALEYVKRFPKTVLNDPQLFYKEVYEPVRDRFIDRVLRKSSGRSGLDKWFKK